jgi:hypothetical protein
MQRTAAFPDHIADARLPQAVGVVDHMAALDAAVDGLDPDPTPREPPIGRFLRARERPAPWRLGGHDDGHLVEREGQEAEVLEPPAAGGQRIRGRIGDPLVVGAAGLGVTQKENRERRIHAQHMFHGMTCLLAVIPARRLKRVLGALDAPFRPIMVQRGAAATGLGAATGGSTTGSGSFVGTTRAAASASVTLIRCANAWTARLGASPGARRVVRRSTNRT